MVRSFTVIVLILLSSCVRDKPQPIDNGTANLLHHGVITLDEGVLGNNNADLSFIDLNLKKSYRNIFLNQQLTSLGDIAQHILKIDSSYWITLNNSNKIMVLSASDLHLQKTITGIQYPRRIEKVNDSILAVSSLYTSSIYFLHVPSGQITKTITLPYLNTEGLFSYQSTLYVCCWNENCSQLYKVDGATLTVKDSISLPCTAAHDIVMDQHNSLWVLCGNEYKGVASHLLHIQPETKTILDNFPFGVGEDVVRLTLAPEGDRLYFIKVDYQGGSHNNGVYTMSIEDSYLPSQALITANSGSYLYALGVDPSTTHIFVSDPKGFNQRSSTYEYTQNGLLLETYETGMGTNQFIFR